MELQQRIDSCTGEIIRIEEVNRRVQRRPRYSRIRIRVRCETETEFELALRSPWWLAGPMEISIDGEQILPGGEHGQAADERCRWEKGFVILRRVWKENEVVVTLPRKVTVWPLPDQPDTVAFLDGPVALAGLVEEERTLFYEKTPEEILTPYDERRWAEWLPGWKTKGQRVNFVLQPLYRIGYEKYTTYFPVRRKGRAQREGEQVTETEGYQ